MEAFQECGDLAVTTYGQLTAQDITDTTASVITVLAGLGDMATVPTEPSVMAPGVDTADMATHTLASEYPGLLMVLESPELLRPLPVAVALDSPHLALALPADLAQAEALVEQALVQERALSEQAQPLAEQAFV